MCTLYLVSVGRYRLYERGGAELGRPNDIVSPMARAKANPERAPEAKAPTSGAEPRGARASDGLGNESSGIFGVYTHTPAGVAAQLRP